MKQNLDQTVQDFIQKVQIKSKLIYLPEDQVNGALMKGFLPQIRAALILAQINKILLATISEQANKIKNNTSESILSEERLVRAIQTAMSIRPDFFYLLIYGNFFFSDLGLGGRKKKL